MRPPNRHRLVLASGSPRRLNLLRQIGLTPDEIVAADLDESPLPKETPRQLASRLAAAKADHVANLHPSDYVLAADTVVALGRRVLPKPDTSEESRTCLQMLSGRSHRVFTALALRAPGGRQAQRVVETRLHFRRLSTRDVEAFVTSGEGLGKAGGYAIQGRAGAFVSDLHGSYSAVVGLPLYETALLLEGLGYRPHE